MNATAASVSPQETGITDEMLAHARSYLGKRHETVPFHSVITRDAIRHFAQGIGDDNPIWYDEEAAKRTVWKRMFAPPTLLYSGYSGQAPEDDEAPFAVDNLLPGMFGLWASDQWTWRRPAFLGEPLAGTEELIDIIDHPAGTFGGRSVSQVVRTTYRGANDEVLGECVRTIKRFARSATRERHAVTRPPVRYTEEDRRRFSAQYDRELEMRRGGRRLRLEDVRVGDAMGPLLKGPLTITSLAGFLIGWGSPMCHTNRMADRYFRRRPGARLFNPNTGIVDTLEAGHWDPYFAEISGLPAGYDFGAQRIAWLGHLISDWAGDDAFLAALHVRLLRPNLLGDVTWLRGQVTAATRTPDGDFVDCTVEAVNQHDERTAAGTARVRLA
jgi:acyl dehydratase